MDGFTTHGKPLKICIGSMTSFVGGGEVALQRLALGLRGMGHEVFLLVGSKGQAWDRMTGAGLRCRHVPMHLTDKWHAWRCLRARSGIRRVLREERPDVLHSNELPAHQVLSGAARGLPIPRVCHHRFVYDGPTIDWFNKYGAERHLFVSRALMAEMIANSQRLHSAARAVVYNGLPLPAESNDAARQEARRRLGLPHDRTLVTFAGQMIELKGIADLLQAWSMLDPALSRAAALIFIGDDLQNQGAYRVQMESLAARLNVPAQFVGFKTNVGEWMVASDVVVVPSHVEPLANVLLEAMSYGLPVIASAVGGMVEAVEPERTGLLVPPRAPQCLAEALSRLIRDAEFRNRLGCAGRQRCAERFSLSRHLADIVDQYRQAIANAS